MNRISKQQKSIHADKIDNERIKALKINKMTRLKQKKVKHDAKKKKMRKECLKEKFKVKKNS